MTLHLEGRAYVSPPVRELFVIISELGLLDRHIVNRTASAAVEAGSADPEPAPPCDRARLVLSSPPLWPPAESSTDGSRRSYICRAFSVAVDRARSVLSVAFRHRGRGFSIARRLGGAIDHQRQPCLVVFQESGAVVVAVAVACPPL